MRPILRPGLHVLRRDRRELQVGLDPRHAVVLSDDADTVSSLGLLSRSADAREYDGRETLQVLQTHGLVLDGSVLLGLIPSCEADKAATREARPAGRPIASRHEVAALARSSGDDAAAHFAARNGCKVDVVAFADTWDQRLSGMLIEILREAGVRARRSPPGTSRGAAAQPLTRSSPAVEEAAALIGVGEPQRELVDGWMRRGLPHLLVRLTEGSVTIGPFVVPGRTACLRCLDAHHTDADPCWPLLVAQYASLSSRERADGVPEPVDRALTNVALGWAARDLASYAEHRRPSTWSTTIRLDPHLTSIETRSWLRHPDCGCAWG